MREKRRDFKALDNYTGSLERFHLIDLRHLTSDMYELSVIKVINPSCFFCKILGLKEGEEYEQLFLELNMLYGHKYRDVEELRPASLSIEQRCMVFCEELKSWCRAVLESDTCSAKDELVECFLLDHAVFTPIKKSDIRFPIEEYYRLPFRAKKFKLHQIQPISLGFNVYENKMDFRPRKDWDLAAISYFHQLLEDATKIKADFCSVKDDYISVYLYITTKDSVLCVNDELVAKKFASYYKDNSVDDEVNGNAIIPMVNGIQSPGQENGPVVKELQSPGHQNAPLVKELQSPGHQNAPMVKQLQSPGHQNGSMVKELQSPGHQNAPLVNKLQSLIHQNGSMVKQLQSPGHQNAPLVNKLQSLIHQNGSMVKELQSPGHQTGSIVKELKSPGNQNGSLIKELQSPGHQNGSMVKELQFPGHQNASMFKKLQSIAHQNGSMVKELQSPGHQNGSMVKELQSPGRQNGSMVKELQSPGHQTGSIIKELKSPGHQNGSMVKELQSPGHQTGSIVKELKSPGHQNGSMVKELQFPGHQNASMFKKLQSIAHQNGSMVKELQSPGRQNGSMVKELQSPGHQNGSMVKELQSPGHQNGSIVKELKSPGNQNGSMIKELQSPGHQNGSIVKELKSPGNQNGSMIKELQSPGHQNGSMVKELQSPGHQNGSMVKELQFPGHQNASMFKKLQSIAHQNGSMVKELQSPGHQNGSMVKELQSPGHQNGVKSVSLSKEEAQVPIKESPKIASQPILWSAWRCLDGGHTTDIQQESRSVPHKEKPPFLANQSGKPSDFLSKDSTTQSLRSPNGSSPVLLQTDEPPLLDNRHGNASLSLDRPNRPSSIQEQKIMTGPETVTPSTWNNIKCGPKLFQDVPERAAAEIRGHSEEKTCPLVREVQDPLAMPTTEEFAVVQSPWPALCNVDRARRMSTEIKEESIARIRTPSGNVSSSAPDNMRQAQNFTKLLHFLNPNPAQLSEEENDEQPKAVRKLQEAVFVSKTLTAYHTLESALLCSGIKKRLMATGYSGPNLTESYCWAPIAEGSDTIVITPDCSNPMYYIPPLLTYLNCASAVYKVLPGKHGPHAIVLCSSWDKCHTVYNLLMDYSKCVQLVNPMLVLVGQSKEEIEGLNLRKPHCLVVTTPHCLLRCMEHHGLLLLRLCHLVLDEVDVLFAKARSQMSAILEAYKKTVSVETRDDTSQQVVAIGNAWHQDMESLLNYTSCPQVIITRMEQAAVFANVQQILHLCLDCEKMSVLLQCLDFTPVNTQKILIFTSSDEEAELVHKVVQTGPTYNLLLHRKEVYNFTYILEQWKKVFSRGTVLALVVTDDYAPILDITDATCIIHYSFPQNTDVLNKRLFSLLDYIQSKMDKVTRQEQDCFRAKSILLMTDKHARHAVDVLNSLQQAQAKIPLELIDLTEGIQQAKEELKSNQELCPHLKRLGYCIQDKFACPNRHHINPMTDLHSRISPVVEADQNITVLPLCIVDASCFYGRIVKKDDPYEKLAKQLNEYYQSAENKVPAGKVETNQLYALSNVSAYHRVLVLQTKTVASVLYVTVKYIDEGGTDFIPGHKLLKLPLVFQSLPPQYLEFIICRVKPIDTEVKWDSKVTRIINRSIRGKHHRAKVVLNLGKTYWLDPMVQISSLAGLSTVVYDLNVRQEIFATGMATDNPEHVTHLKALLNSAKTPLMASVRSSSDECLTGSKSVLKSIPEEPQVTSPLPPAQERKSDKQEDKPKDPLPIQNSPSMSFHPIVKWYEKGDTVFLAVKLQEITDHKCTFHPTRVLFSCHAEGKHYKADFDLYKEIVPEKSQCSVKSGEAIITLEKKNHESWARLQTQKHPYVSYDYDQLEDSEDSSLPPAVFQERLSKSYTYMCESAVSTDYSDTESTCD